MRHWLWRPLYKLWAFAAWVLSRPLEPLALGRVLLLSPHPDDETIGAGALLSILAAAGLKPVVVMLTDGSASHEGHPLKPEQLALRRIAETEAAVATLGIPVTDLHWLGAPDSGLAQFGAAASEAVSLKLAELIDRHGIDTLLLPHRADGTSDHECAHRIGARALALSARQPSLWEFPIWARWIHPLRWPLLRQPLRRLALGPQAQIKRRALACHASQFQPLPPWSEPVLGPCFAASAERDAEYFVPARAPAAPATGDVEWQLVPLAALPSSVRAQWLDWHRSNPGLDSAYFHPAYAESLRDAGWQVECAVCLRDGQVAGVLPLQREGGRMGMAGMPMSDFQGFVSAADERFEARELLEAATAGRIVFDHWLPRGLAETAVLRYASSPLMDIAGGMVAYRQRLPAKRKDFFADTQRIRKKAAAALGPLRFDWQVAAADADAVLARLIEWKTAQYARTGAPDFFAEPRHRDYFVRLMRQRGNPEFEGVLSALWAGDELLAVHAGLRARSTLHWWLPAYDPKHGAYSPGRLMLDGYVDVASAQGIARIDLGKGDEFYKRAMMTGARVVAEGALGVSAMQIGLQRQALHLRETLRRSRLWAWLKRLRSRSAGPVATMLLIGLPFHELPI